MRINVIRNLSFVVALSCIPATVLASPYQILQSEFISADYSNSIDTTSFTEYLAAEIETLRPCSKVRVVATVDVSINASTRTTYAKAALAEGFDNLYTKHIGSSDASLGASHNGTLTFIHEQGGHPGAHEVGENLDFGIRGARYGTWGNAAIWFVGAQILVQELYSPDFGC